MFTERLEKICDSNGSSKKDFAIQIGIPHQTFQKYTSGKSLPGYEFFLAMHRHGINIHWLLSGEGEMYRPVIEPSSTTADPEIKLIESVFGVLSPSTRKLFQPLLDQVKRENQ